MVWFLIPVVGAVVAGVINAEEEKNRQRRREQQEREQREELERERQRVEEARRRREELERQLEQQRKQQQERERKQREELARQERERQERLRREEEQRVRERQERERREREEEERWERERAAQQRRMEEEQRRREEERRKERERMEAERERERQERERQAREQLEKERRQREEAERREQERRAKEAEALRQKEEAARAAQKVREEEYAREQERLRAELEKEKERERAELERKHEENLRKQEEEKARKEAELKQQGQEQHATQDNMKEHIQAQEDLYEENAKLIAKGISPNLFPTEEQWKKAKERLVCGGKFHCAVSGLSGVGKSSLVNGLRGISNKDPNAAKIGVVETTTEITAYPDITPSRSHWVWYDVPGAGTLTVPAPQYFNAHGLFVFDLIIVVIDNRFTAQDIAILHQCRHFKIPSFIVRSKANQQITNIMHQVLGYSGDDDEDEEDDRDADVNQAKTTRTEMIAKAKEILIRNTRENVKNNLEEAEFDSSQRVYVVSAMYVRSVVTGTQGDKLRGTACMIDEEEMIKDLHRVVEGRSRE